MSGLIRIRLVCDASVVCLFAVLAGLCWMPGVSTGQDSTGGAGGVANKAEAEQKHLRVTDLYVLERDAKLSEQIGQSPEQRTAFLVAMQQYREVMSAGFRAKPGEQIDPAEQRKKMEDAQQKVLDLLNESQHAKLQEIADAKRAEYASRTPTPRISSELLHEVSSLRKIQSQLRRLLSDPELVEDLGLTMEQRVELKDANRKYLNASVEMSKSEAGHSLAGSQQLLRELVMESQRILTPEQSEQLTMLVRLEELKREYGDEFASINGLADDFGLDDQSKEKLKRKIEEVRKDFYDDWMKLKKKSMQAIIDELPRKHREEVEEAFRKFVEEDPRDKLNRFRLPVRSRTEASEK